MGEAVAHVEVNGTSQHGIAAPITDYVPTVTGAAPSYRLRYVHATRRSSERFL